MVAMRFLGQKRGNQFIFKEFFGFEYFDRMSQKYKGVEDFDAMLTTIGESSPSLVRNVVRISTAMNIWTLRDT